MLLFYSRWKGYNSFMIELMIPGRGTVQLEHLVCDLNGTLAVDGQLQEGVIQLLGELRDRLTVHILSADTHRQLTLVESQLGIQAARIQAGDEIRQKARYIEGLGADQVAAIGQGANDCDLLKRAAIGICVLSPEGTAVETLLSADLVVPDIHTALELFKYPLRLVATLRK